MSTNAFDPFRELDRFLGAVNRGPASLGMPMDLYRDGDRFVVAVDLPGVDPGTIDIDVEDRTLTIRAERVSRAGQDVQWLTHERAPQAPSPASSPWAMASRRTRSRRTTQTAS